MMRKLIYTLVVMALTAIQGSMAQTADHSVKRDLTKSQMTLRMNNNEVKYYNLDQLKTVAFEGDNTMVTTTYNTTDTYTKNVGRLSFSKTQDGSQAKASFDNTTGKVAIKEAKGWLESLYMTWDKTEEAESYNIYIKGGQYSTYTKVDGQLVRDYGTYGRVDIPGLKAADDYEVKVVPVKNETEVTEAANVASGFKVKNYSREGFAHLNYSGIGAYNDDGTLKSNAKVLYITSATAKTVTTSVLVDKTQKEVTGLQSIIDAYQKGTDTTPLAIRIIGKVTLDDLDHISSSAEGLQVKGRNAYSEMNITIEGIGEDATISGFGILVRNCKGVEMRNFAIMLCLDDCISLDTNNSNIWIHNIDLFYGKTGGDADQAKGDGTVDLKGGTKYVTISSNRYWDSGKSSLCGMGDDEANYITYQNNWFDHSDSRHPRIRCMTVHIWNNYYDGVAKYGVGATTGSSAFVEANYFRNCNKPMLISMQGSDINNSEHKGTFSSEDGGIIKSFGNIFAEKSSNFKYVTYQQDNTEFDAYEAKERNETVPAGVKAKQGGTGYDNFDTNNSLMYTYAVADATDVPANVTGYYGAGRLNHGDFAWDFTGKDSDYNLDSALKSALESYKSSLVKIFGGEELNGGGETGGEEGGETGGEEGGETESLITCHFTGKTPSNNFFTISGNYSNTKGTATVDGVTYKECLKIESSTSIAFTITEKMTMTLYFGSEDTNVNIKVDKKKISGDTATKTLVTTLEPGPHTLTKGDTCNLFFIKLEK